MEGFTVKISSLHQMRPTKQRIIGSIFDEKLLFEKDKCRTTLINEVAVQICRKDRVSNGTKKGKHIFFDVLSYENRQT